MLFRSANPQLRRAARTLVALLCIVLVVSAASVELFHHHADGDHHACALCMVAHAVSLGIQAPALLMALAAAFALLLFYRAAIVPPSLCFALFTRPPPASR